MKALIIALVSVVIAAPATARQVSVRGHVTKSGTYIAPSTRTAPNSTRVDNWSSRPNVNPYTGKSGTTDPYAPKPIKPFKLW